MATSDERPPVWVGHVVMPSTDVGKTTEYLVKLGLRPIERAERFAVLEFRGGTHLVVLHADDPPAPGASASFDLMYEDLDAVWKQCDQLGYQPSAIEEGTIHRSFAIVEPGGHEITVNSSHVGDLPV